MKRIGIYFTIFLLLSFLSGLSARAQTATITADSILTESRLDARYLDLDLSSEFFVDYQTLTVDSFILSGAPSVTTIEGLSNATTVSIRIHLAKDNTDFSTDYTHFKVIIRAGALVNSSADLHSNELTIFADPPAATITPDATLTEQNLNNRYLNLVLTNEEFKNTAYTEDDFILLGAPDYTTIDYLDDEQLTSVTIYLDFTGPDFDIDFTDFRVSIDDSELKKSASPLISNSLTIYHYDEPPEATITPSPSPLNEQNLNSGSLTVKLTEEYFINQATLEKNDFSLLNAPPVTSIESLQWNDSSEVILFLDHDGKDFDNNFTQFRISINHNELFVSTTNLLSNTITIYATNEPVEVTIVPDATLSEYTLDGRYLTLTVAEDTFINLPSLDENDFILNNEPDGLTISSVTDKSKNQARLNLSFVYNDFDNNITNFRVTVKPDNLLKSTSNVNSNNLTINCYVENPQANATADSPLEELTIDERYIDINFSEEWFETPGSVTKSNFDLLGEPDGVSIENVTVFSENSLRVLLAFNNTDFDDHFPDFRVSIDYTVLVQSGTNLLTNKIPITPVHEPDISSITIPDQSFKVGDIVQATLELDVKPGVDSSFTLYTGDIGGYSIDSLKKYDNNTYYAYFTLDEGEPDYSPAQDIPVSGIQLRDGPIFGAVYNTPVSHTGLLDANTPVVYSILVVSSGIQKIGDKVFLVVSTDQKGYSADPASVINGVSVNAANIKTTDNNNGTYTFTYTIQSGNQDVIQGNLQAGFIFSDQVGNMNPVFNVVSPNDLVIDANAPMIDSIRISSSDDTLTIDEILSLTIFADEDDYDLDEGNTKINNVPATASNVGFSKLGGGRYGISYQVKEGDNQVSKGNLIVQVVMVDNVGNKNTPFSLIQNNDVAILTTRPAASLSGTRKICEGDAATLYVTLTGIAPWKIEYSDGTNSEIINNISTPLFEFDILPETSGLYTYQITMVQDATQNTNTGTGSAFVTVNQLPVVSITGLEEVYSREEEYVPLNGTPPGGDFIGRGVIDPVTAPEYFNPKQAGTDLSPHTIFYRYTDANGCINTDSAIVNVISASADIHFEDLINEPPIVCWYLDNYTIYAENTSDSLGTFTTEPYFEGFLTDHRNNTATLHPNLIDWDLLGETQYINVDYHFPDSTGFPLTRTEQIKVEYFEPPRIIELDKTVFCSNEPAVYLRGTYLETGTFSKPAGVSGDPPAYTFNPALANIGNTKIYYTQQNPSGCLLRDSIEITVNPTPVTQFNYLDTCIDRTVGGTNVRFQNTTDTNGLGSLNWAWTFGDFYNNTSTEKDPLHLYQVGGSRTISLTATTIHGCTNKAESVIVFGDRPESGFKWQTECFTTSPIKFEEDVFSNDPVKTYRWRLYNPDGSTLYQSSGANLVSIEYLFPARDEYPVELEVETELGCRDSFRDTILLRPFINQITADEPYFEDFEADAPGWYSTYDSLNTVVNSWTFGDVKTSEFPFHAASGTKTWYTSIDNRTLVEQSWVSSPCFNLSGLRRPMIRFSMKRSFERDRDGAILQYTTDHGKTWKNLGTLDDGSINWYNSFRIQNGPGGQEQGWTGEFTFSPDASWVMAKHELDILRSKSIVQFRFAYGSDGSSVVQNEGFAIDDIYIGERKRLVLLEHFTSAADEECKNANQTVNNLVTENMVDIIDIQYHVGDLGMDKMYTDYPIGPGARSLYYGISTFPHTFFDGGGDQGLYIYDYTNAYIDELDLFTRVLQDPVFDIALDASIESGQMNISVALTALNDLELSSYAVHTAIIEKEIDDPAYYGPFNQTRFENVVRRMLPDAGGTIFTKEWTKGDVENLSHTWNIENVLDEDQLYVVIFVQNRDTKEVYQAATNDPDALSTPVGTFMQAKSLDILVFPNPASEYVNIAFSEPVTERSTLQVFNYLGALVEVCQLENGISIHQLDVQEYGKGIYYLKIIRGNKLVGVSKMVVF